MLRLLFTPGKKLMRQLRMPAKFSLIVLTLLIALAMLLYLYVDKTNEDIDFAGTELTGVAYQRVVNPLTDAVLRLRGQLLLELLGMPDAAAAAARGEVEKRLAQLERALRGDDRFGLAAQFAQVKQAWTAAARYTDTAPVAGLRRAMRRQEGATTVTR